MLYNSEEAKPYFSTLGWILIISYLGFYFFNTLFAAPGGYENIFLRILISFFGFILILYKFLPKIIQEIFPLLFYLIILVSFPFFFTYMLLKNQDLTAWHVKGLIGFVLLSFFVDWISFIVLSILGVGLALACISNEEILICHQQLLGSIGSYSAPIIYQLIFSKKKRQLQEERSKHIDEINELNQSLEKKVKARTTELEKALAYKTEFLNNLSHEIRTPLHGFISLSDALYNNWNEFTEEIKYRCANEIAKNAQRLEFLVNNLLDIAKFTANKMLLNFQEIDINTEIQNIIDECSSLYFTNKSTKIVYDSNTKYFVTADKEKLAQVIRNLIVNAIKYGGNNSIININIDKIVGKDRRKMLQVAVKDSGVGIPEEELQIIFEPFIQSSMTKKLSGGTGLGLSICKQIINAHQGEIWANNNIEGGSSFYFTIPL